jgi:hypothetical protein
VVCPWTGLKMHDTDDPELNPKGYPKFEQGKIFTAKQGGGYQLANLIPESFAANRARNDKPTRRENLGPVPKRKATRNAWCPTGPGGGQDNSCSSSGGGAMSVKEMVAATDALPYIPPGDHSELPKALADHVKAVEEHMEKLSDMSKADLHAAAKEAGVEGVRPGDGKMKVLERIQNRLLGRVRAFERALV